MGSRGSLKPLILLGFSHFPPKRGLGGNRSRKGFLDAFRSILESDDPRGHKEREEGALGKNLFSRSIWEKEKL